MKRMKRKNLSQHKPLAPIVVDGRRYVDSWTTPHGMLVSSPSCEHCDGERSRHVRNDHLRGWVCPLCDSALDEMLNEGTYAS